MKTKIVRIGNSQGIRIPKSLIEQSGLSNEIEMILRDDEIVLRSIEGSRKNWDRSFQEMSKNSDDYLIDEESVERASEWDETEWTW